MINRTAFFLCLLLPVTLSAQLKIAQVTDYSSLISNVFGLQCGAVQNVQVTGSSQSIGHFQNGQPIGVQSGLIMSTGKVAGYSQSNYSPNWGTVMNYPGDAVLSQTLGVDTHDAIVVEFDFTPTDSDTIKFSYVFASDEYPEYANSQYRDGFLFLVSENGGTAQNVALIPGTVIPVHINTINDSVNSEYYVDNYSQSAPNHNWFVFDGYTLPLEARFFAIAGNSYHIKLVIADASDAIYDSAIFLEEHQTQSNISGNIDINGTPGYGLLEIFSYTQDTVYSQAVDSLIVTAGYYYIDSIGTGLYNLRFTPDSSMFPNVPPVYFTGGSSWATATTVGFPCYITNAGLHSDTLSVLNGDGSISGMMEIDTSYLKSLNVALPNAWLYLYESGSNKLIAFTQTDQEGNYLFEQVPLGYYYILADVPFLPQLNHHYINLNDDPNQMDVNFAIEDGGIHALGTSSEKPNYQVRVFPNPASQYLEILCTKENFSFTLTDINGHQVFSGSGEHGGAKIDVSLLSNGVYILQMNDGTKKRVVKS